jgi:hypothetical protein
MPIMSKVGVFVVASIANPIASSSKHSAFVYERVKAIILFKNSPGSIMARKNSEMLTPASSCLIWYFSNKKAVSKVMTSVA